MQSLIGDRFLKKFAGVTRHRHGRPPTEKKGLKTDDHVDLLIGSGKSESQDVQEKEAQEHIEPKAEITKSISQKEGFNQSSGTTHLHDESEENVEMEIGS